MSLTRIEKSALMTAAHTAGAGGCSCTAVWDATERILTARQEGANRRRNGEISSDPLRFGMAGAREALVADLSDEHGCSDEDEDGRLIACTECCERAVRLAARLAHERLLAIPSTVCKRCGQGLENQRVVPLEVGGFMCHTPCWMEALDAASDPGLERGQ